MPNTQSLHHFACLGLLSLSCMPLPSLAADSDASGAYSVFTEFDEGKGGDILSPVVFASDGYFYGTSGRGGVLDYGTVYRVNNRGIAKTIHSFHSSDGYSPHYGLTAGPDGQLYGLTSGGGLYGGGVAFKISRFSGFSVLHNFFFDEEGDTPFLGSLVVGLDSNFYGTLSFGGLMGGGSIFSMTPSGTVTVLHRFNSWTTDGIDPYGALTLASDGLFYGTTTGGGNGSPIATGTVFRTSASGDYSTTYSFSWQDNIGLSNSPWAAPIEGPDGYLYGTTFGGGVYQQGSVYRVARNGSQFKVLHSFHYDPAAGAFEGYSPRAKLLLARDGKLYGTTTHGGKYSNIDPSGGGTLFSIARSGEVLFLHSFGGQSDDGLNPYAEVIETSENALFGTTSAGGKGNRGTIFRYALP